MQIASNVFLRSSPRERFSRNAVKLVLSTFIVSTFTASTRADELWTQTPCDGPLGEAHTIGNRSQPTTGLPPGATLELANNLEAAWINVPENAMLNHPVSSTGTMGPSEDTSENDLGTLWEDGPQTTLDDAELWEDGPQMENP